MKKKWGNMIENMRLGLSGVVKAIVCCCVCMLLLGGCKKEVEVKPSAEQEDKLLVGFSMGTLMEDRWLRDRDIFIAMAKDEGMEVIINNANKDSELQYEQVLQMIKMKIDVLVIAPNNSFSEAKCVEAAKEKGIPVISYDRLVEDSDVDLYISFDNEYTGKLMGKHVIEKVPEGNYLILNGSESDSNSEMLRTGYKSVLDTATKAGKIKIVAETYIEGWIREDAFAYVSEQLEIAQNRNIKIDAIICANDSLARGAIDALSEAGMAEGVVVVGQDADLIACQNLVNGKQSMTIYKPISSLVAKTVESSLLLAKGETISTKETYENGSYEIPYIKLQPIEVTKENLEETIIKDGFHLKKDIYGTTEQE